MPNGKPGDSPIADMLFNDAHPFPADIEELLRRIDSIGRAAGRWPLGENWPYAQRDLDWAKGRNLDEARRDLLHLLKMLEDGRGDEVLVSPLTMKPFRAL
jgi:hypothetical protein